MVDLPSPTRILWLTPDKPDDISVGRHRIAEHLASRGFHVSLDGTSARTVLSALRNRAEYDLIIGTTRAGALAAMTIGRVGGLPVIVDHIDPIQQLYDTRAWLVARFVEQFEDLAFHLADHVLFVYEEERNRVADRTSHHTKTHLGVDYGRFADPDEAVIRSAGDRLAEFELNESILIYVGGLEPIYNVRTLLDAMAYLSGWSLVIAGAGSLEPIVKRRARTQENIEFLGTIPHDNVPGYLHHADVGVSLVDDPHTLKVLEYLSASIPVVQLDGRARGQFDEFVTYTTLDPAAVADAVVQASLLPVSTDALEYVHQFTWSRIADTYERVICQTLQAT